MSMTFRKLLNFAFWKIINCSDTRTIRLANLLTKMYNSSFGFVFLFYHLHKSDVIWPSFIISYPRLTMYSGCSIASWQNICYAFMSLVSSRHVANFVLLSAGTHQLIWYKLAFFKGDNQMFTCLWRGKPKCFWFPQHFCLMVFAIISDVLRNGHKSLIYVNSTKVTWEWLCLVSSTVRNDQLHCMWRIHFLRFPQQKFFMPSRSLHMNLYVSLVKYWK